MQAPDPQAALPLISADNYKEIGERMVADFLDGCVAGTEQGWTFLKVAEGVSIDRKPSAVQGGLDLLRGSLLFNTSPEEVWRRLIDSSHLKYVDYYYESSRVVEKFDEEHSVVYYLYAFPWPMSKREFISLEVYKKVDDNTWIAISSSVRCSKVTDNASIVRGVLHVSGYKVERYRESEEKCVVTTLTQADTGGYIPKWLVNKDAGDQPLVLARIRSLIEMNVKTYNANK
eukprot:TRINITY_DN2889_c0_g1_i1.p1 TRINITY_DN2889_c0_g1~~TRINITY_DN2889_c0_g1_i1.p1  ORF type:complete len:230 (+),score=43.65 TRINITY_DN2889_c0_g1_i1:211-900(+)